MSSIIPTITAENMEQFWQQYTQIKDFAHRIHLDYADGSLAPRSLLDIDKYKFSFDKLIDVHLMVQDPDKYLIYLLQTNPNMIILHAESSGNLALMFARIHASGIKSGLALLQSTTVESVMDLLPSVDHVLIFSGRFGYFGGVADLTLLEKVIKIKQMYPDIEVGWDGGVGYSNANILAKGGVDVLNVGGAIHNSKNPEIVYRDLQNSIN